MAAMNETERAWVVAILLGKMNVDDIPMRQRERLARTLTLETMSHDRD